jgi:fructoselysine-6-P-deglycase FrlB-like protein
MTQASRPPEPETWSPDPAAFVADLEAKPDALSRLATSEAVPAALSALPAEPRRVLLLGMGSSRYAAQVSARRLRQAGMDAVAEYASTRDLPPPDPGTLVVAISATGGSKETLEAVTRYAGKVPLVAVTGGAASPLAVAADVVVPLVAGKETGGVACRTFQHTGLVLAALEARLTGRPFDLPATCARVADATADLLATRDRWLEPVSTLLDGPDGVHVIGPAERWSSVAQSALMFREGPRRPATASETGDWNHVDVYLTKTTDYRALLLTGSAYDDDAMAWMRSRGSTVVAVGRPLEGAAYDLSYRLADDEEVARHTETLIAELVAATWWLRPDDGGRSGIDR